MARAVVVVVRLVAVNFRCDACLAKVRLEVLGGDVEGSVAEPARAWSNSHKAPVLDRVETATLASSGGNAGTAS